MKLKFSILLSLLAIAICSSAEKPAQILDRCANQIRNAKSLTANYSMSGGDISGKGSITLAGDKFRIISSDMSIWYDGKTQWSYMPAAKEVNIVEPTPEELQEVNPFAIINSLKKTYEAKNLKAPAGTHKISFTAKNAKATVKRVDLTINAKTMWPTDITLHRKSGSPITIKVTDVKTGTALPIATFRFDKKKYPGVEVVDLR